MGFETVTTGGPSITISNLLIVTDPLHTFGSSTISLVPTTFPRPNHTNQRLEHFSSNTISITSRPSDCRIIIKDMKDDESDDDVHPDQMDDLNPVLGRISKDVAEDTD